jgi:hypothetical protein
VKKTRQRDGGRRIKVSFTPQLMEGQGFSVAGLNMYERGMVYPGKSPSILPGSVGVY